MCMWAFCIFRPVAHSHIAIHKHSNPCKNFITAYDLTEGTNHRLTNTPNGEFSVLVVGGLRSVGSRDPGNPRTWSLDDPLLWLHEEVYRKYNGLPSDAPIPDHPPALRTNPTNLRKTSSNIKHTKPLPRDQKTPSCSRTAKASKSSYTSEAVAPVKKKSHMPSDSQLKARLTEKKRSDALNEMLLMKDPDFDVEEDWYTPYEEHFTKDVSPIDEDFALWLAAEDYKLEENLKKHVANLRKCEDSTSLVSDESLVGINRNRRKKVQPSLSARNVSTPRAATGTSSAK